MTQAMLTGCFTALITPFDAAGAVDSGAFAKLVEWQIAEGIHGLVPVGSTGEAATMTLDERLGVVRLCAECAAGRVPVIAGAGGNDTRVAIETSKAMGGTGATHLLHVSPMYSNLRSAGFWHIFGRSPMRRRSRSSCTTCPAARRATSKPKRRSRSRSTRISYA